MQPNQPTQNYEPELIEKIRKTAFENEFKQSPQNPICPQACGWDNILLDGSYITIVLTLDVHDIHGVERKLLHLSVGLSNGGGHASEEITKKVVGDLLGTNKVIEIPQYSLPFIARNNRQFFFEVIN